MEPGRLFEALDGRELSISGHNWQVEVYSVSDLAPHRWIQLAVKGDQPHMLTLRLEQSAGAQDAVMALSTWLGDPSETQANEILNVA
jgi:hypothetical protein